MDKYSEIKQKIRAIATGTAPMVGDSRMFLAEVKEVTGDVCSVVVDDMEITDVRLTTVISGDSKKIVITPKRGSVVFVADVSGNMTDLVLVQYTEIEKIDVSASDSMTVNCDSITINGGNNGGLTNTPELKKQLDKLTARVDGIINAIKNSANGVQDGGAQLKITMVAGLSSIVEKEDFSKIEDEKVKH